MSTSLDPIRTCRSSGAALLALLVSTLVSGCFHLMPSEGGGQAAFDAPRNVDASDVALPAGFAIEVVATGLDFPTGIAFDDQGHVYVTEAGYSYGDVVTTPRLLRIADDGSQRVIAEGSNPPWNGVAFEDGAFYVAGGHVRDGQILRIDRSGNVETLLGGLPSLGDHHTNGPVVGPEGWIYFGQGTATNAGVVGMDNFDYGWVRRYPDFHDVPCKDITLSGKNFTTPNPLTPNPEDRAVTGAYVPFGEPTSRGQVIPGELPCSGAILRVRPDGSDLELVAWGFRNPFGLSFSPEGELYVTENQFDVRGSRPVFGTGDLLWRVERGSWHGWPDFYAGYPIGGGEWYDPPDGSQPTAVLQDVPSTPPHPVAKFGVHSSSNGLDFSDSDAFGYRGDAFVAQFGGMAPATGKVMGPVGFKVVRVDTATGVIRDFAVNRGKANGPASWLENSEGLERPVSVRFSPAGTALYVVDFGVMTTRDGVVRPRLGTGVLWRIVRTGNEGP